MTFKSVLHFGRELPVPADYIAFNKPFGVPFSTAAAPVNTDTPVISGSTTIGSVLVLATPGTWTGNPTPTLTYQWQVNGVDVEGETDPEAFDTTGLVDADAVTLDETAVNTAGTDTVTSNTITMTDAADVTAPILTTPLDDAADDSTRSTASVGSVVTDEGNGIGYAVVSTSITQPTKNQIKAGQMHTGAAAAASDSVAVLAAGVINFSFSGLTPGGAYFTHYMQEDAALNQSNIVTADGFSTNQTTFVAFADGDTANTVTFPTHEAPTGTQKHLAIGFEFGGNDVDDPPAVPAGVGWTQIPLPDGGGAASVGVSITAICKYCATAAETFGTNDATTPRCVVGIWELSNAPTDPLDAIIGANDAYQNSLSFNKWASRLGSDPSWIMTAMGAQANQATADRNDISDAGQAGTFGNRVRYGRSTDATETAWEEQNVAVAGATDTGSVTVGIIP